MAAWLLPAVRTILPYISSIVAPAMPIFTTRKSDEAAAAQTSLLQKQVTELQSAASQNAQHVKELAEQLQKTIAALEEGALIAEARFRRTAVFCGIAIVVSIIALCVSLISFVGH